MDDVHPLKAFREKQTPPLSQQQLADLLDVDRVTVTRWESGSRRVDETKLDLVSERTGIGAAQLRPDLARYFPAHRRQAVRRKRQRRSRAA
jgi:transcriptional regulator with XRE-family HTH domain